MKGLPKYFLTDNQKFIFVCFFGGFFIFFNLWSGSLYPWDEGWYGEIAREIIVDKTGWLTLHYNQSPFFEKPPLFIWMIAWTFKVIGINEFAVRLWSAVFGLGCLILVYLLTEKMSYSKNIAVISALTLLSFSRFYRQSRLGMMDVPLAFFILLGVYLFWLGRKKKTYLLWIGPVIAIAIMIKSFAALVLPFILILFSFLSGERKLLINHKLLWGVLLGMLICLPWHLYQYTVNGSPFIDKYFFQHIVKRAFETFPDQPERKIFYYFTSVIFNDFPVGLVCYVTLPYFFLLSFREKRETTKAAFILLSSSILAVLVLFTFIKTKLHWYVIPVYPFLSISVVISMDSMLNGNLRPSIRKFISIFLVSALLIVPAARIMFYAEQRTLDFSPELKDIAISAKKQSSNKETILFYDIKEETSALFYLERSKINVSKEQLRIMVHNNQPFICIISKEDGYYHELLRESQRLKVTAENGKYMIVNKA